jgi:hopene-associated glycosyltransferase HpnB
VFFFFKLYPPAWTADPRRATAGAAGGCLLVRPAALDRAGGLEAIRGAIIDDCALARAVKRGGGKLWLGMTDASASIRPYGSFAGIGHMISRTAFNQLRHSALLLLGAVAGLALTYLLPPALLFSRQAASITLGAAAWALMITAYLPMVRFYRLNPLWALTLPLAAVFYMGATIHSAVQFWRGQGGGWKGRTQDPRG